MTDSDEWSPEKDKDPMAKPFELMEKYMKKLTDQAQGAVPMPQLALGAGPGPAFGYAMAYDRVFHVRKISNGFVASHLMRAASGVNPVESFCKTPQDVAQAFIGHIEALDAVEHLGASVGHDL